MQVNSAILNPLNIPTHSENSTGNSYQNGPSNLSSLGKDQVKHNIYSSDYDYNVVHVEREQYVVMSLTVGYLTLLAPKY